MCRRNQLVGCVLSALGAGALLTLLLGGGALCVVAALGLIGLGLVLAGKQ